MSIILTTDFSPDDSESQAEVCAHRDGKLLLKVIIDFSAPRQSIRYELPIDAHAFDDFPHQELALILYHASLYIDAFFCDEPPENVNQEDGSWTIR